MDSTHFERIPEFFSGRCIFITGASGFIGKVLVEKLLRSCSELEALYILVRPQKNKHPQERWDEMVKSMVFDRLRLEKPGILERKVKVLPGDCKTKRLGLSDNDYKILQENVSVVFHVAASVRFNDPLPDAVFMNTRGTFQVINLALGMKDLKVFAHVSTAYCNCYLNEIEEEVYPPPADWRKTIEMCENLDKKDVAILSSKYMGPFPNTYTFTKNLAECMVLDYKDKLPLTLLRPSIVIGAVKEPIPGWIDTLHGPGGLILAGGTGIARIILIDKNVFSDYMPVDVAVKAIIVAAWKRAQCATLNGELPVYNVSSTSKSVTNKEMIDLMGEIAEEYPPSQMLWYPSPSITTNRTWFKLNAVVKHLIPALMVDLLLRILGKNPMSLLKKQEKIQNAMLALGYFTTAQWVFHNHNFIALIDEILPEDAEDFNYDFQDLDPIEYIKNSVPVAQVVLLKAKKEDHEKNLRRLKRLYWLDKFCDVGFKSLLVYSMYCYFF